MIRAGLFVFAALLIVGAPANAADEPARGAGTITRLVKVFRDKEAALATAVRNGDATAVGGMLADDFELRAGARAASPVPRDDWIRAAIRTRDPGGEIGRMAVHDLGNAAVASFTQDGPSGPMFVVDIWRGQGDKWKLAVRYASPAGTPAFVIPGVGAEEKEIPKKY
jgi:hypothetical protein